MHGYKVLSVTNPTWSNADSTEITCMALFAELEARGPLPFTVHEDADTLHGVEIWEKANAGEYGAIAPFPGRPSDSPEMAARLAAQWIVPPKPRPKRKPT